MILEHRSSLTDLTEIDPSYYGTGLVGEERKRLSPIARSYYTIQGQPVEAGLQNLPGVYATEIDENDVYDLRVESLVKEAQKVSATDIGLVRNTFEQLVLAYNYKGYTDGTVVVWFYKLPVVKIATTIGSML